MALLHRLLDRPWIYRLSQVVLAPGADTRLTRMLEGLLAELPPASRVLDVGCGPASRLWRFGLRPAGLDRSDAYVAAYRRQGGAAVVGSADALPFASGTFDGVWCLGLLHHLPDDAARRTADEMVRVCRSGGYVVVLEIKMPEPAWRRPLAWGVRRFDRGRHIRRLDTLAAVLGRDRAWTFRHYTYSVTGLEGVLCILLRAT